MQLNSFKTVAVSIALLISTAALAQRGTVHQQPSDNGFVRANQQTNPASSAQTVDELQAMIDSTNAQMPSADAQDQAKFNLLWAQVQQSTYKIQLKQFNQKLDDEAGVMPTWLGGGTGSAETRNLVTDYQQRVAKANVDLQNAQSKSDELNNQTKKLAAASAQYSSQQTKAIQGLATALKGQGLVTKFSLLQAKMGSANTTLNEMSKVLDKAAIGAYMKDKVSLLLNSPLVCESAKACPNSSAVSGEKVEQSLFPNTKESTRIQDGSSVNSSGPGSE